MPEISLQKVPVFKCRPTGVHLYLAPGTIYIAVWWMIFFSAFLSTRISIVSQLVNLKSTTSPEIDVFVVPPRCPSKQPEFFAFGTHGSAPPGTQADHHMIYDFTAQRCYGPTATAKYGLWRMRHKW